MRGVEQTHIPERLTEPRASNAGQISKEHLSDIDSEGNALRRASGRRIACHKGDGVWPMLKRSIACFNNVAAEAANTIVSACSKVSEEL